jgi:hypothetical protein
MQNGVKDRSSLVSKPLPVKNFTLATYLFSVGKENHYVFFPESSQ